MPPKVKTTREMIIKEAMALVREECYENLNARALAAKLNCSVQPIFRNFASMEDLKKAIVIEVAEDYQNYLKKSMSPDDQLMGLVLAYVTYARDEKNYFKLLHMSNRMHLNETSEFTSVGINHYIIEAIAKITNTTLEEATLIYQGTFFTAHGIASMVATNQCEFSDEEIQSILNNVFAGMLTNIKNKETEPHS